MNGFEIAVYFIKMMFVKNQSSDLKKEVWCLVHYGSVVNKNLRYID